MQKLAVQRQMLGSVELLIGGCYQQRNKLTKSDNSKHQCQQNGVNARLSE
jgi:hypothetical protein